MSNETKGQDENLDLQAILKKAEQQTSFPDVPLDEFEPPTYDEWKEACVELLKGAPFEKKMFTKTYEGITFEPMYTHKMTDEILPRTDFPGMDNFLRGARPNGYIEQPWGIAQSCDETLPEENNELLRHEVDKGSTIYNIRLDSATLLNTDAKDAEKIGDEGCNITTVEDMHTTLNGLKLDQHPIYIYAGASSLPMLSLVAASVKSDGGDLAKLSGFVGADPLGELIQRGENYASLPQLYDEMAEAALWAKQYAPNLKTIMVRSDAVSRGGANDVQEVACRRRRLPACPHGTRAYGRRGGRADDVRLLDGRELLPADCEASCGSPDLGADRQGVRRRRRGAAHPRTCTPRTVFQDGLRSLRQHAAQYDGDLLRCRRRA